MMIKVGAIYESNSDSTDTNLYHVHGVHYHWETRETFVLFLSMKTGSMYVLEYDKFRSTKKECVELN